jgi:hypothetical protein
LLSQWHSGNSAKFAMGKENDNDTAARRDRT